MGVSSFRKPSPWTLQSAFVPLEWRWVHERLLFAYPGWHLQITSDVATGKGQTPAFTPIGIKFGKAHNDTAGNIDIEASAYGPRYVFNNSGGGDADDNHLTFPNTEAIDTPSAISIFWHGSSANTTTNGHFLIVKADNTTYDYGIYSTSSGMFLFYGATNRNLSIARIVINKSNVAMWVSASAAGVEAGKYEDGAFTFSSVSGVTLVNNNKEINVCGRNTDTHGWDGAVNTTFVVRGETTKQDFFNYVRDPFGPFRMMDEAALLVPAVGGLSIPVAMRSYRQHHQSGI